MSSRWSIRRKLLVCLALLFVIVLGLSSSSFRGAYSYRGLVRGIGARASEIPAAIKLAKEVSDLRLIANSLAHSPQFPLDNLYVEHEHHDRQQFRAEFISKLQAVTDQVNRYRIELETNDQAGSGAFRIQPDNREWEILADIERKLEYVSKVTADADWIFEPVYVASIETDLDYLLSRAASLPTFLQARMSTLKDNVRTKYRTWIIVTWLTSLSAALLLSLLGFLIYSWIFCPVRTMVRGSRLVAAGDFSHRIKLASQDEMGELAHAMNDMTRRFQEIRDDLDQQVRVRTREVVRSEQMASVGFLAAGVAHEINNPLASIALCAESLEDRLHDVFQADDALPDANHNGEVTVVRNYLRMIQDEAFRCKQITERLLDFARLEEVERQSADLRQVVEDVVEMVGHLGKYKQKSVQLRADEAVYARVNSQEIKQVVLNLLTNALDSLEPDGRVWVRLVREPDWAKIVVRDNGCGMTDEVKQHLFEPFFTRRRDGQGTGLGLSITYRIVQDHGGTIEANSEGYGKGSEFTVTLPTANEENRDYYRAA